MPLFASETSRFLLSGWNPPEPELDDPGVRTTAKRNAIVELPIVHKIDRQLHLTLGPPVRSEGIPRQSVKVFWNGSELGTLEFEDSTAQDFSFDIPAGRQRIGPNRIELRPRYWVERPTEIPLRFHPSYGITCSRISLTPQFETELDQPPVEAVGDLLLQHTGTVVTFALSRTAESRLKGSIRSLHEEGPLPEAVVVTALDTANVEHELLNIRGADLGRGASVAVDVPLPEDPQGMLCFNLAVQGGSEVAENAAGAVVWENLHVASPSSPVPSENDTIPRGPYNVLVVLYDALRADYLAHSGHPRIQTPILDGLAEDGVVFADVVASSSWTRPSVASLLSGQSTRRHGVHTAADALAEHTPYLPEILNDAGYTTLLYTENPNTNSRLGFARGFDEVHEMFAIVHPLVRKRSSIPSPEGRAEFVWERFLEPFFAERGDRPYFMFLHHIDPHHPYSPPEPYDSQYGSGYRGNIQSLNLGWHRLLESKTMRLEQEDVLRIQQLYMGEITFMDRYFKRLTELIAESQGLDDLLIVFLSDHGEEFLEHGQVTHGKSVFQEVLRVPLVFALPGALPSNVVTEYPAHLVDIPRTILDLVDIPAPTNMGGNSLLPWMTPESTRPPVRPRFAHQAFGATWVDEDAVLLGRWKLIRQVLHEPASISWVDNRVFDLDEDPAEYVNRFGNVVVGKVLEQLRRRHVSKAERGSVPGDAPAPELSAETIEALEALGYR